MSETYRFSCAAMFGLYRDTLAQPGFGTAADGISLEAIERVYLRWQTRFRQRCPEVGRCATSPDCTGDFSFTSEQHARATWFGEFRRRTLDVTRSRWGGKVPVEADGTTGYRAITTDDVDRTARSIGPMGADAEPMQLMAAEVLDQIRERSQSWTFSRDLRGGYERAAVWRLLDPETRGDVVDLTRALHDALKAVAPDEYDRPAATDKERKRNRAVLDKSVARIKAGLAQIAAELDRDPDD